MCRRYRRTTSEEEIARQYNIPIPPQLDLPISYNIAPAQNVLVIRLNPKTNQRTLDSLRAGLSEIRLGKVISKHNRDEYVLSTKVGRIILNEIETGTRNFGEKGDDSEPPGRLSCWRDVTRCLITSTPCSV